MGSCGCGKKQGSFERPLIAGRPNGAEPVKMRLIVNMSGEAAGSEVWVTGNGISLWLDHGLAVMVETD